MSCRGDTMIYICAKCKFLFERKNEPSKCPSCENQSVMDATENERMLFKQQLESRKIASDNTYADLGNP